MLYGLTRQQFETLRFIRQFVDAHGFSPNYREISDGLRLKSVGNVHRLVHALVERGYVRLKPAHSRSIVLTQAGRRFEFTSRSA